MALHCRYMMGTTTGGIWLSYFLVQVPLIVAERVGLALLKRQGAILSNWTRIAITIGVQNQLGHWLFWPVVVGPLADQVIGNIAGVMGDAAAAIRGL